MTTRIMTRLERLEQALTPEPQARLWHVCLRPGETDEMAVARHGVQAGPADLVVIHGFGLCLDCQARAMDPASGA